MKIIALVAGLVFLSGCDLVNKLKYEYYFNYRGKMLCIITEETGKVMQSQVGQSISIDDLNSSYPVVTIGDKMAKYNKMVDNEKMLNLQKLEIDTGSSHLMIIQKQAGQMLYTQVGIENDEISYRTYRANCK